MEKKLSEMNKQLRDFAGQLKNNDKQLMETVEDINMFDKHELNKLIEAIEKAQAPVNVAYGGRIDKALGVRSRDIG